MPSTCHTEMRWSSSSILLGSSLLYCGVVPTSSKSRSRCKRKTSLSSSVEEEWGMGEETWPEVVSKRIQRWSGFQYQVAWMGACSLCNLCKTCLAIVVRQYLAGIMWDPHGTSGTIFPAAIWGQEQRGWLVNQMVWACMALVSQAALGQAVSIQPPLIGCTHLCSMILVGSWLVGRMGICSSYFSTTCVLNLHLASQARQKRLIPTSLQSLAAGSDLHAWSTIPQPNDSDCIVVAINRYSDQPSIGI